MYRSRNEAELYLRQYPELERWINRCVSCHAIGYKPDMPERFDTKGVAAHHLQRYFRPLAVDELGRCDVCAEATG